MKKEAIRVVMMVVTSLTVTSTGRRAKKKELMVIEGMVMVLII